MHEISLVWFGYYYFFWFILSPTAEAPKLIFTQNTSKDAVPRKDVPFGGLETKIEWLDPHFREKPPFCGPVLAGLRKFLTENHLTMMMLTSKLPFIIVCLCACLCVADVNQVIGNATG